MSLAKVWTWDKECNHLMLVTSFLFSQDLYSAGGTLLIALQNAYDIQDGPFVYADMLP